LTADGRHVDGEGADKEDVVVVFCTILGSFPDMVIEVVKSDVREGVFGLEVAKVFWPPGGDGYGTWLVFAAAMFPDAIAVVAG
jgi:hypothetical protein